MASSYSANCWRFGECGKNPTDVNCLIPFLYVRSCASALKDYLKEKQQRQVLQDYDPAQQALDTLEKHNGSFDISFDELWGEKNGLLAMPEGKSLWQTTLKVLRNELCGKDDSFRTKVQEYTKNPGSAPLLTGLIVSLVGVAGAHGLPLDPAIATVIVLYIIKIGLNIFCEYNEPPTDAGRN